MPRSRPSSYVWSLWPQLRGEYTSVVPPDWTDERCVLLGTGRALPTDDDRAALGAAADRLPVLN